MKLFNAIAAAAVIGASFIAAHPAEARNGLVRVGENMNYKTLYMKMNQRKGAYRQFHSSGMANESIKERSNAPLGTDAFQVIAGNQ